MEKFIRRNSKTATVLELYAKNKSNSKERRTRAFKIAQKIIAAHKISDYNMVNAVK